MPGKTAPILVTEEMVAGMAPGGVVVDLAAERGGNCALTKGDEEVVAENGVIVLGPTNLPATVPYHASQMYAKNISTLLLHLTREGALAIDTDDEIAAGTLVSHRGQVVHPRVRELLGGRLRRGGPERSAPAERTLQGIIDRWTSSLRCSRSSCWPCSSASRSSRRCRRWLHTPLMSGNTAISGITVIGAILSVSSPNRTTMILGFLALVIATINVVGGFLVTHRMLGMFRKKD